MLLLLFTTLLGLVSSAKASTNIEAWISEYAEFSSAKASESKIVFLSNIKTQINANIQIPIPKTLKALVEAVSPISVTFGMGLNSLVQLKDRHDHFINLTGADNIVYLMKSKTRLYVNRSSFVEVNIGQREVVADPEKFWTKLFSVLGYNGMVLDSKGPLLLAIYFGDPVDILNRQATIINNSASRLFVKEIVANVSAKIVEQKDHFIICEKVPGNLDPISDGSKLTVSP